MQLVLFIAGFGALGCLSRYYLSDRVCDLLGRSFPYGTMVVNVLGAFIIGLIMESGLRGSLLPTNLRIGLTVGFLGGFTTFSTFSYETFKLLEDGELVAAVANVLLSVMACLIFTWLGIHAARHL